MSYVLTVNLSKTTPTILTFKLFSENLKFTINNNLI